MSLLETASANFAAAPLAFLIAAHLLGDFVLQNEPMALRKASSSLACFCHVVCYSAGFGLLLALGLPFWAYFAILAQHFAQDRWGLHLRWMRFYGQSTPDKWPIGPLCVDQALHVSFIALVAVFI